jgi:hypothetical protein
MARVEVLRARREFLVNRGRWATDWMAKRAWDLLDAIKRRERVETNTLCRQLAASLKRDRAVFS